MRKYDLSESISFMLYNLQDIISHLAILHEECISFLKLHSLSWWAPFITTGKQVVNLLLLPLCPILQINNLAAELYLNTIWAHHLSIVSRSLPPNSLWRKNNIGPLYHHEGTLNLKMPPSQAGYNRWCNEANLRWFIFVSHLFFWQQSVKIFTAMIVQIFWIVFSLPHLNFLICLGFPKIF